MSSVAKPIGIVIPWFGRDLLGAERHAWELATRLAKRGHRVEVITTCCRSFQHHWSENDLPAGLIGARGLWRPAFPGAAL